LFFFCDFFVRSFFLSPKQIEIGGMLPRLLEIWSWISAAKTCGAQKKSWIDQQWMVEIKLLVIRPRVRWDFFKKKKSQVKWMDVFLCIAQSKWKLKWFDYWFLYTIIRKGLLVFIHNYKSFRKIMNKTTFLIIGFYTQLLLKISII